MCLLGWKLLQKLCLAAVDWLFFHKYWHKAAWWAANCAGLLHANNKVWVKTDWIMRQKDKYGIIGITETVEQWNIDLDKHTLF